MNEAYIAITRTDGSVAHYAFQCKGRFFQRPLGGWEQADEGLWRRFVAFVTRDPWTTWLREPTDANVSYDVSRVSRGWADLGDPIAVRWRRLTDAEHQMFERDRTYRDAMVDDGAVVSHDMTKARELHRAHIRHLNGDRFMTLDRELLDAREAGDTALADAISAKRQVRIALVSDPRIDAAQTIDELKVILPPDDTK